MVFLLDVDDTLLDNDEAQNDYLDHIARHVGPHAAQRYWMIFRGLFNVLGYADYLGALQLYRLEDRRDRRVHQLASYILDYPFADRLYPRALDVLRHLQRIGQTVILTDGDAVLQPRKIERSGLGAAVGGRVLICVHKERELDDVARLYPADHYVLVDDKLRVLSAVKKVWGSRVTTVQPLQGRYALDPEAQAAHPPADITVGHVGDLLDYDPRELTGAPPSKGEAVNAR
jgi:phosphoglycolate phosphatase-like HAD superfamily hydrolase